MDDSVKDHTCATCKKLRAELADLRLTMRVGGDALRAFTRAGKPLYSGERQEMVSLDEAIENVKRSTVERGRA